MTLHKLDKQVYRAFGYVFGLVIVVTEEFGETVSDQIKSVLRFLMGCIEHGPSNYRAKTMLVAFTYKKTQNLRTVFINDVNVLHSDEVKYLGVTLNKKLSWNSNLGRTIGSYTA